MVQHTLTIRREGNAKGVTLAQLRQFVEQAKDLDGDLVLGAKATMGGRLHELTVNGK